MYIRVFTEWILKRLATELNFNWKIVFSVWVLFFANKWDGYGNKLNYLIWGNSSLQSKRVQCLSKKSIFGMHFGLATIYTHIWSLQPFHQDYNLVSNTIYVVCVNICVLYVSVRTYSYKSTSNEQDLFCLETLLMQVYLHSDSEICWEIVVLLALANLEFELWPHV